MLQNKFLDFIGFVIEIIIGTEIGKEIIISICVVLCRPMFFKVL